MKKRMIFLLLAVLGISMVYADPSPRLIPFQGRLTDQNSVPYTNGQYTLIFTLYDQAVGGTPLWNETHENVGVINGMINVFVGAIQPLDNIDFSEASHLGITIDADGNPFSPDPEMVPHQLIVPAFWAKQADNADQLDGYDWGAILGSPNPAITEIQKHMLIPSGVIVMWSGAIIAIPDGWALCDGNNGTPDLRDQFVKGVPNDFTNPGATGDTNSHYHGVGTYAVPATDPGWGHRSDNGNEGTLGTGGGAFGHQTEVAATNLNIIGLSAGTNHTPPYFEIAFIMKL